MNKRLRNRAAALVLALLTAFTMSTGVLAADVHYLINGVASGSPGGILNPPGANRDALGMDRNPNRFGLKHITDEMIQRGPAYYGVKKSREANAPDMPAPKDAQPMTPGQLAEKYHITIIDQPGYLTGPYGEQAVALIDAGLQAYSTEFIHALVDKWAQQGVFFCISLHYPKSSDDFKGVTEINSSAACVNLVVPAGENPGGVSVGTVVHEFGHAVYLYLEKRMGKENLARQWMALNGPYQYGSRDPNRAHAFVNNYGSQYYYEDPATIFEAFADAPDLSVEKLSQKDYAPLRKKAEFLEQCVENYIGTPGSLFSTVWDAME